MSGGIGEIGGGDADQGSKKKGRKQCHIITIDQCSLPLYIGTPTTTGDAPSSSPDAINGVATGRDLGGGPGLQKRPDGLLLIGGGQ